MGDDKEEEAIFDHHIERCRELPSPEELLRAVPCLDGVYDFVRDSRRTVRRILSGEDRRLLAIVGPCSIHDAEEALAYAARLRRLADEIADVAFVVMRVYCEKPRTTTGWKGLLYDPGLDDSGDIERGLHLTRELMREINLAGVPCACEFLDPILPQYFADLIAWGAIGARTAESQLHRQLVSGLSMPVGFKNATSGSWRPALCSIEAASRRHSFPGLTLRGRAAICTTTGNPWGHLILRGGETGPNYGAAHLEAIQEVSPSTPIVVDCSHGNSGKDYRRQPEVLRELVEQQPRRFRGFMLESNLVEGSQPATAAPLLPGVSVTDGCLGIEATEALLRGVAERERRRHTGRARHEGGGDH